MAQTIESLRFLSKGIYNIWYVSEELYTEYSSVMYMLFDGVVIYNDSLR